MSEFKLSSVKELFPNNTESLQKEDQKVNYGHMFNISVEEKKKVVELMKSQVDECKRQREEYINTRAECIKNYEGIRKPSGPWSGSSNISTGVTTIAVDMIHSRLFPMVWNPDLIYWKGTTKHSEDVAENNKIFTQWFLTKDMECSQEKADEILGRLVADGIVVVKRVWEKKFVNVTRLVAKSVTDKGDIQYEPIYDKIKKERASWEIKDIEHVFIPYNATNEDDAEYIIEEIFYTLPMLREMKARKLILDDVNIEDIAKALKDKIDPQGGRAARLNSSGIEVIDTRLESTPIRCYEGCLKYDINKDEFREECIFLILPDLDIYLSGKPLHCVSRIGKRPWKIGGFIPRFGTIYAKGIPELVRHLHNELDAIHNQRIDAGNMVIAPFFFFRAASGFDPKAIAVKPATGIPLDDPQRDVYFPDYNPSRLSVSFQEENIIMDLISKLTYLPPTAFGRETASRPTARGTIALIAESGQPFNLLASRVLKVMLGLITDTRKMYEEHWDNNYAQAILNEDGKQVFSNLSPEMIAGDYLAFSAIDLEKSNASFEAQADQVLFQTLAQDPMVNQNPAFAWELRAGFIKGLGKKDVEKLIGPRPDYENNPGIVNDENHMIMKEIKVEVSPKDDHVAHMNGHSKFKREMANVLTPEAMSYLTAHILEHRFEYMEKMKELQMTGGNGAIEGETAYPGNAGVGGVGNIQGPRVEGSGGVPMPKDENSGGYEIGG